MDDPCHYYTQFVHPIYCCLPPFFSDCACTGSPHSRLGYQENGRRDDDEDKVRIPPTMQINTVSSGSEISLCLLYSLNIMLCCY